MSASRLDRVKEILDDALGLDPEDRAAFVHGACGDDTALRREIESLLAAETATAPLLDRPLFSLRSERPSEVLVPGQRIGPYQVVRVLGEGGMGTVVLAVREDDFEKRVALKVVRRALVTDELVARFRNERQILAQLDHPNVARILDGGTFAAGGREDGLPYLVMEYVEGEPIDAFCRRHGLSVEAKLALFRQVCAALQAAHRNLVVHRDLKPSNILVTADGIPKLLDFGIAKRLADHGALTRDDLTRDDRRPMTLRYASPEQVDGGPIGTSSDVYSLGVVLYELLAGRSPYPLETDSELELARAIRDEEPLELDRDLGGDLRAIVLKTLRKEPEHRYGSVDQLSEDLERYLEGLPVAARKGTWRYRTGKFVRRHKLGVAAVSILVVLGLAFAVTVTVLWQRAVEGQERSERTVRFLKDLFVSADPDVAQGRELTAQDMVEKGLASIDEIEDPVLQVELLRTVGEIFVSQGLYDAAREPRERELAILRRRYGDRHPETVRAINNLGGLEFRRGDLESAERLYREALDLRRAMGQDPQDLTKAMSNLAMVSMIRGRYAEAETLYREALDVRRRAWGEDDATVGKSLRDLGVLAYTRGDLDEAEALLRRSLEIRLREHGPLHTKVAAVHSALGRVLHVAGRLDEAREQLERALEIRRELLEDGHPELAASRFELAALDLDLGRVDEAAQLMDGLLPELRQSKVRSSWELAEAESVHGALLVAQGRETEGLPYLRRAYDTLAGIRGEEAVHTREAGRRLRDVEPQSDDPAAQGSIGSTTRR